MTAKPLKKHATYDDLRDVPDNFVAEIFDGELYASPRPAYPHAHAASVIGVVLGGPFHLGRQGPGGWVIVDEPELRFGSDVLVPDLAGWRRERFSTVPSVAYPTIAPDWVCEVLSPSTEALDRSKKLRIYAREGVAHVWLVNPILRTLEALALARGALRLTASHEGGANIRAAPFDAIEFDLGALWV
jgi:Uma2 family endonuclease